MLTMRRCAPASICSRDELLTLSTPSHRCRDVVLRQSCPNSLRVYPRSNNCRQKPTSRTANSEIGAQSLPTVFRLLTKCQANDTACDSSRLTSPGVVVTFPMGLCTSFDDIFARGQLLPRVVSQTPSCRLPAALSRCVEINA